MVSWTSAVADLDWFRPPQMPVEHGAIAAVPYSELARDVLEQPIFTHVVALAAQQPDRIAISEPGRQLSYQTLCRRVRRLAARLADAVPAGVPVAVLLPDGLDAAVAMLACFAAGRLCLMLTPEHPAERITAILEDAATGAVIVQGASVRARLPDHARLIDIVRFETEAPPATPAELKSPGPDDPALVIYTSGSTGRPKGIVRSHRQVAYLGWKKLHRFHLNPSDTVLAPYTLTTGGGLVGFMMTLIAGARFCPINVGTTGLRGMLDLALHERATVLTGTPSLLRTLFASRGARAALASLRVVYTTGETLARTDVEAWRTVLPSSCAIAYVYGMSEAAPLAEWFLPQHLPEQARLPIGFLNPDHEYAIRIDGSETEGELWVRSRLLSLGEWHGGALQPGRMASDPNNPSVAVLATGDRVRRQQDGLVEFAGRTDFQVKIRGNRVEPQEVEAVLRRASNVAEVTVLAQGLGESAKLVAFIVRAAGTEAELRAALREAMRAALPSYMHPEKITFIDRMPVTPSGKVDVAALRKKAESEGH